MEGTGEVARSAAETRGGNPNGRTTTYKYNDAGERVVKRGEQGETAYVNQFFTVRNRSVGTKHVFVGETRLVSKLVPGDAHVNPGNNLFGNTLGQWWWHRSPNGFLHAQNTVKNPHYAGNVMPQKLPEDNFVYFYHPDHVGSTSYVTDYDGALYEHVQYFPFGETWVSEQSNTERLPYLFTSKELDEETALYYFGARYYDPRTSVWQSTDPALGAFVASSSVGEGVFRPANLALLGYVRQNPVRLNDPSGLEPEQPGSSYSYDSSVLPQLRIRPRPARTRLLGRHQPDRLATTKREIAADLKNRNFNRAITRAAEYWNVQRATWTYDPLLTATNETAYAVTIPHPTRDPTILVGDRALSDPATLLSTMGHERVHVQQFHSDNWAAKGNQVSAAVNELEAYDAELRTSGRLGLSRSMIAELRTQRAEWYAIIRKTSYKVRVDGGNYRLLPKDK